MQIHVGGKNLRFGIGEFALITGLNLGEDPREDVPHSTRLAKTYLNDNASVRSQELNDAFIGCIEEEDAWKLGLCYFVDGVLHANVSQTKADMYMFSLVENEEAFFQYPFGKHAFKKTIFELDKDMINYRGIYKKAIKAKKKVTEAKYTVYGYTMAL